MPLSTQRIVLLCQSSSIHGLTRKWFNFTGIALLGYVKETVSNSQLIYVSQDSCSILRDQAHQLFAFGNMLIIQIISL